MPLVADFLRKKKPEVVAETGDRLEKRAYALVVENGYQKYNCFPVLDAAWPTVAAALPRFVGRPNKALQTFAEALYEFLNFTGHWDEWLALARDAEREAVEAGDFLNAGWWAYQGGWIHYLRRQSQAVLASADHAEDLWHIAEAGPREMATAIQLRGFGHELAGNRPAALAASREAVKLWRSLGRESDVAIGLNDLADAERSSADLEAAERHYREALGIYRTIDDLEGIAITTGNLSELALLKDLADSEALAREALSVSEIVGHQQLIAVSSIRLAIALIGQDKKVEALSHAQRAADVFMRLDLHDELAVARRILAQMRTQENIGH